MDAAKAAGAAIAKEAESDEARRQNQSSREVSEFQSTGGDD